MNMILDDTHWMQYALHLAERAQTENEVPIGAVLVQDNQVLGEGWNQSIQNNDPSAHAEMIAIRAAAQHCQNYRLPNTTLYVTLEPCPMCAGLLVNARIARLVFATSDPRAGAVISVLRILDTPTLNHRVAYESGVLAEPCSRVLKAFFKDRR